MIDKPFETFSDLFTKVQIQKLNKLAIHNLFDLILYLPNRYEDRTRIFLIKDVSVGQSYQVQGQIKHVDVKYFPRKNLIVTIEDQSSALQMRFINFYPNQVKQFREGEWVRVFGELKQGSLFKEFIHPDYEIVNPDEALEQNFKPIYSLVSGIRQKTLATLIQKGIRYIKENNLFEEFFPELIKQKKFPPFIDAVDKLHCPPKPKEGELIEETITSFRQRFIYDELLSNQLFFRGLYQARKLKQAPEIQFSLDLHNMVLKNIGFSLTKKQINAWHEIMDDLGKSIPMNRLLQGDVGSGKTVVASLAAFQAARSGYQVAFMAPTEILAEQHMSKLSSWLVGTSLRIELLTGSLSIKDKELLYKKIAAGEIDIVVGTHALFQEKVRFKSLAFYIIDEQHRFGVEQRLSLRRQNQVMGNLQAHQLMMSATPIPRTLSMSYFADMDISIINELPPGRQKISTRLFSAKKRNDLLKSIDHECSLGNQVYWVCPLIDESEKMQLETVINTHQKLQKYYQSHVVEIIHGKMKAKEKDKIMCDFKDGKINILVATSVIEVGVDVPNATLMVIENSERLGLSQLHQLRGRIGRGVKKSTCMLLFGDKLSDTAKKRLRIIYDHDDGFLIAEEDLKIRGPGEFLGLKQSGLPSLRIASLENDEAVLNEAKSDADKLLKIKHPSINSFLHCWLPNHEDIVNT